MKQLFYIEREELQSAERKVLSLCIGKKYFSFAITNFHDNNLYSLGYFTNDAINDLFLAELFSKYVILSDQFSKVLAVFDFPESVLVTSSEHQNNPELLLETMYGNCFNTHTFSDSLNEWQMNNIYSVPGNLFNWIRNKFPSLTYSHIYSAFLRVYSKSVRSVITDENDGCLLLDFKSEDFSVIALKSKKILLAQTYAYSTPGDVLFHLLKICRHFSLSQEKAKLLLSGLIEKRSALLHEISQFFLNVEFRDASDWANIISTEKDHQPHYFTSLNDLAKCAS